MFLRQNEFMSLIGMSSVAEVLPWADIIKQNSRRARVSIRVEPSHRLRQGKTISVWPDISQIEQQMVPHPNLHYEVVFGLAAAKDNPETLRLIIKRYASSIYGIVWKGRPDLSFIHDISLRYPCINQAIRLDPSELSLGDSRQIKQKLQAWQMLGIHELLVPVQHLDHQNFLAWRCTLELIIRQNCFAIRLEQASSARIDLMRKLIMSRGHYGCGIEVEYDSLKPLLEQRNRRQQLLALEGVVVA